MLLSGDRETEVSYLAEIVGITEVEANKSPEEKLAIVEKETGNGKTVYVGDGINDAPALMAANVGIAFGQNSEVTAEAAGAVILDSSLRKVDELIHIGRRMRRIALQSAIGGMAIYGIEDASRGFLQPTVLPELSEALEWEKAPMELVRGLLVDPRLHFKSSDLLWKVKTKTGDNAYVLISFDHQTRPDKWMAVRFLLIQALAFMKMLDEDDRRPKQGLPVIYCVVLYQGTEPWNAPLELEELINWDAFPEANREAISGFTPRLKYQVVALQTTPEDDLPDYYLTRLGLTLMKAAILHEIATWVRDHQADFLIVLQRVDGEYILQMMFNYAVQKVRSEDELEELNQAVESLEEPSRKIAMNGAQILEARGKAEGKASAKIGGAEKMLQRDFEPELIAEIHEIPLELVEKLAKGEEPDLAAWIAAVNPQAEKADD